MMRTISSIRRSLPRWQIPELADASRGSPAPALAEVEHLADVLATDNPNGGEAQAPANEPSIAEMLPDDHARGYAEGWEQGLSEGREKGYADASVAAEAALAALDVARTALSEEARRLAVVADRLGAPIAALDAAVENAVVALALEIARCVIGSEVSRSRDYLVRLIREALAKVPIDLGAISIVLSPADHQLISRLAPEIADGSAAIVTDDAVAPGDCRIIADSLAASARDLRWRPRPAEAAAQVNLSLATRWRAVMRTLFEEENK
jgi:flagellar assembly protein FliH